jgi:hypothetical protein
MLILGAISALLLMAGCSGSDDRAVFVSTQSKAGVLNGSWGGLHIEGGTRLKVDGTIKHKAGQEHFSGSFTVDGTPYSLTGTIHNNVINATLSNSTSTITWNGAYAGRRFTGSFTRSSSGDGGSSASGTVGLIQFLDIQGVIEMGPWLQYMRDDLNGGTGNKINIRIALTSKIEDWYTFVPITTEYKPSATVTVTDTVSNTTYGPYPMDMYHQHKYQTQVHVGYVANDWVDLFQYSLSNLPSNRLFNYTITIKDSQHKDPYSVSASFRTPPSLDDIQNGSVTSQTFYAFGDNRKKWGDTSNPSNYLPFVEEALFKVSPLATDPSSQTCIIHNGDASTLGQQIYYCSVSTNEQFYGWREEWLKSSNNSDDPNGDWRYHTWLRASLPTYMSAGNHDAKDQIGDKDINIGALDHFGYLMAEFYSKNGQLNLTDKDSNSYDTFTYATDYGGVRVIVLNVYYCFSKDDSSKIVNALKGWLDGAGTDRPIVLVIHAPWFDWDVSGADTGYWHDLSQLRSDLQSLLDHRKNLMVMGGHVHETARAKLNDVNYYILGGGGAPDFSPGNGAYLTAQTLTGVNTTRYLDFAWAQVRVDYKARNISCTIYHTDGSIVDNNSWTY